MTEDELRKRLGLMRQSTDTWRTDVADFIRAAATAETGDPDKEAIESAERILAAIKEEQRSLEETTRSSSFQSDELEHDLATVMTELYKLEREVTAAVGRMRHVHR